jgi:hypothetical protein
MSHRAGASRVDREAQLRPPRHEGHEPIEPALLGSHRRPWPPRQLLHLCQPATGLPKPPRVLVGWPGGREMRQGQDGHWLGSPRAGVHLLMSSPVVHPLYPL